MEQTETNWEKQWAGWEKFYGSFNRVVIDWLLKRNFQKLLGNIKYKGGKILGLGSGTGNTSLIIARITKAKEMVLVDRERKALEISKKLLRNSGLCLKARFLQKDILDLNLNEKFDIVHSEGLLEHLYGDERTLGFKKHADFCQEGGIIVIFVPFKSIIYRLLRWFRSKLNRWPYIEEPFSKEELYQLSKRFGLEVLKEVTLFFELGILAKKSLGGSDGG